MIEYRFSHGKDRPFLRTLWREAFPADTDADIDAFLACVDLKRECMVAVEKDKPVSMVFMLPAVLRTGDDRFRLQYIYAAATLKAFRGRGIFGELLKRALSVALEQGCIASALHPAQPSLQGYYARFGYTPFFYSTTSSGEACAHPMEIRAVAADEYTIVRNERLPESAVEWPSRLIGYAIGDEAAGMAVLLGKQGEEGCAFCRCRGDRLLVDELLCDEDQRQWYGEALAARLGCRRYECRIPAAAGDVLGMIKPFTDQRAITAPVPFMGLVFD